MKREFLAWAKQQTRTDIESDYATRLMWFEQYCPVKGFRQVTHQYVIGFRQWRLEQGVALSMINKNVATLNGMLNKNVDWQRIGANPIAGVKRLSHDEPVKDRRPLTVEEVESLFENSPADILPVWYTFVTTGIRHFELVDMLFEDVDFDLREVTIRSRTAKNHKARMVPLCDEVLDYIVALRERAAGRSKAKRRNERNSSWPISRETTCSLCESTRR